MKRKERAVYRNKWERGTSVRERIPKGISLFQCGVVAGFVAGEGSFFITISKIKKRKLGYQIRPMFSIQLKKSDRKILDDFQSIFGCGKVYEWKSTVRYTVSRFTDIVEVIIPFFEKYQLPNVKETDFQYFKIVCYKLLCGEGKNVEGIKRIRTVTDVMNVLNTKEAQNEFRKGKKDGSGS